MSYSLEDSLRESIFREDLFLYNCLLQEDAFDALASILTPIDETQYWADVSNAAKKKEERDKAGAFWNTLEPVAEEFQKISTMQLPGSCMPCLQGVPSARALRFWVLSVQLSADSVWANGKLAEAARQLGKMVEHPN